MVNSSASDFPDTAHQSRCRVLYGDTDSGGVVYYANYLRYFEHGRTEFMRALGVPYRDLEEQGMIMPVVEAHARYRLPARYDDLLVIETALTQLKKASCRFSYRLSRDGEERPLAFGWTVHAVVDRRGRPRGIPHELVKLLQATLQTVP